MTSFIFGFNITLLVLEFLLANFIFYRSPSRTLNRLATLRSLSVGLFALATAVYYIGPSLDAAQFWNQLRALPFLFMPALSLWLAIVISFENQPRLARLAAWIVCGLAAACFAAGLPFQAGLGIPTRASDGAWLTVLSTQSFIPWVTTGLAAAEYMAAALLGARWFFAPRVTRPAADFAVFLGLALPIPAIAAGWLLAGTAIPEFPAYLAFWGLSSDAFLCAGLYRRSQLEQTDFTAHVQLAQQMPDQLEPEGETLAETGTSTGNEIQVARLAQEKKFLQVRMSQYEEESRSIQRHLAELEAAASLSAALRSARTVPDMLTILLTEVCHSLSASAAAVLLLHNNTLVITNLHGLPAELCGTAHYFGSDLLWKVIETNKPVFYTPGVSRKPPAPPSFLPPAETICALPLKTSERQLGLLLLLFDERQEFSVLDQSVFSTIAELASNALYRASLQDTLEQRVTSRTRNLQVLYRIAAIPNRTTSLEGILDQVLDVMLESVSGKAGVVFLAGGSGMLKVRTWPSGLDKTLAEKLKNANQPGALWAGIYHANQPMYVQSLVNDIRIDYHLVTELMALGDCSVIGAPVHGPNEALGSICLFSPTGQPFAREDLPLLSAVADQLGIMLENVRLHRIEEQKAILEDRQRLRSDLHDTLSSLLEKQAHGLASAGLELARGDLPSARASLERLQQGARRAQAEMRLLIYELSPSVLESQGLLNALEHRIDTVERRAGIQASIRGEYGFRLPGVMERDFYRIALEILDSILINTQATRLWIELISTFNQVSLKVAHNDTGVDDTGSRPAADYSALRQRVDHMGGVLILEKDQTGQNSILVSVNGA